MIKGIQKLMQKGRIAPRTVRFRIEDFETLVGPVHIIARTKPPIKGARCEPVYDDWVTSPEFSLTLSAGQRFPITVRGKRYPMDIGETVAKETKARVDIIDKKTWPQEALWRGSRQCLDQGYCIHEDDPFGPCLPCVELPAGVVMNGDEICVLRVDGPPVAESQLESTRREETKRREVVAVEADTHLPL